MKKYFITPLNQKSFVVETTFEKDEEKTTTEELYRYGTAEAYLTDAEVEQIKSLTELQELEIPSAQLYEAEDVCYSESDVDFFELHEDWEFDDQLITVIGPCEIEAA